MYGTWIRNAHASGVNWGLLWNSLRYISTGSHATTFRPSYLLHKQHGRKKVKICKALTNDPFFPRFQQKLSAETSWKNLLKWQFQRKTGYTTNPCPAEVAKGKYENYIHFFCIWENPLFHTLLMYRCVTDGSSSSYTSVIHSRDAFCGMWWKVGFGDDGLCLIYPQELVDHMKIHNNTDSVITME